jgi:hypothetical protein
MTPFAPILNSAVQYSPDIEILTFALPEKSGKKNV